MKLIIAIAMIFSAPALGQYVIESTDLDEVTLMLNEAYESGEREFAIDMTEPVIPPKPERRIFICMPGTEEWNRDYLARIEAAGFPMERVEYMLQITARINSVFPDEDIKASLPDGMTVRQYTAETTRMRLERAWSPKPFTAWYYDYEPRHRDEDGNVIGSWLWPRISGEGFSKADVLFLRDAYAGCADVLPDIPGSIYGVPRVIGYGAPNPLHVRNMKKFRRITRHYGYAQLNLYPMGGPASNREITKETAGDHVDRILLGYKAMDEDLTVPGTPIWAMMWPRWITDNEAWFALYLKVFRYTEIDTLIIWVNPHSELMSRIYANETIEAIPHIVKWLNE